MGSAPNSRLEISMCYGIRWFKCKLKPPNNRRLKHRCHPGHQCNHEANGGICGKWFFAKSDLNKHAKIHEGQIHQCYECGYTTLDKRYLEYINIHTPIKSATAVPDLTVISISNTTCRRRDILRLVQALKENKN